MIELEKIIHAELKAIHPRVIHQNTTDTIQFPYLVYDIPNVYFDGESGQIATVDIDGWDDDPDTAALENLMALVKSRLDKKTFQTEKIAVTFYLDSVLSLIDDDPRISRRKYIFQARVFERS